MPFTLRSIAASAGVLLLVSCATAPSGTFGRAGFAHREYNYQVTNAAAASPSPLGPQWRIDNFYRKGASLLPKKGPGYEGQIWVDADGDGVVDDLGERPHFDLRFTHARS